MQVLVLIFALPFGFLCHRISQDPVLWFLFGPWFLLFAALIFLRPGTFPRIWFVLGILIFFFNVPIRALLGELNAINEFYKNYHDG